MKRLVLVGGGHAHLSVLEKLARAPRPGTEVILITPNRYQNYSGMLPGWIAGHYTREQSRVDLQPLVQASGVRMITASVTAMSADTRTLTLSDGQQVAYDLLSLDVGSETQTEGLSALGSRLLPVKPLDDFFDQWPDIEKQATRQKDYALVVVGGGAAGVELAFAAQFALERAGAQAHVTLVVSPDGILKGHHPSVRRRVLAYTRQAGIVLYQQAASGLVDGLQFSDGHRIYADQVIAATGAKPLPWLRQSGLSLNQQGYILVDACHRTQSHPEVFAVGDTCARTDVQMARSGVHAVKAGPVLADNLYALLDDSAAQLKDYQPRKSSLYLLACGPQYAIASWGRVSFEGHWVWRLKDWIDRGFIKKFSRNKV
jgi:pyridine nucleotide-disulfide oxidoreductase family protein